ncbi:MAG: hypothetical protein O3C43_22965 [Verrucomicrobia bacterium]|nr:hypothetical protein [Verrucomicrobiota bacterium]
MKPIFSTAKCSSIFIFLFLFISIAEGVTKTGTINADETWSGVIETTGNVTIAETVTVTVNPGTIVKMGASDSISNDGTFSVIGTAESPIYFTSIKDDTLGGDTNADGGLPHQLRAIGPEWRTFSETQLIWPWNMFS